jgi:PAS domain S-box-containing protein
VSNRRLLATTVLIVGLALTVLAGLFAQHYYQRIRGQQTALQADSATYAVRVALDRVAIAVHAVRSLYATSVVTPGDFDRFAQSLTSSEAIRSLSFYRRVAQVDRQAYESRLRTEPGQTLGIWQYDEARQPVRAPDRAEYFVVEAAYLLSGQQPNFGLDVAAFPGRAETIERAVARRELVASPPVDFIDTKTKGILLYAPTRDRNGQVTGIVAGSISFQDLTTIAERASGLAKVSIIEEGFTGDEESDAAFPAGADSERREFDFGHRKWAVVIAPASAAGDFAPWALLLILGIGLASTAAVLIFISNLSKTGEIDEARARLRGMLDGLGPLAWLLSPDGTIVNANRAAIATFGRAKENGVGKPLWALPLGANDPVQSERLRAAVAAAAQSEDIRFDLQYEEGGARKVIDLWIRPLSSTSGKPSHLVASAVDVTDRYESEETQRLLMRELDHRMKNTLQVIQAIIRRTARSHRTVETFEQSLLGRVNAMSRAHELLAQERWLGADASTIIRQETSTFDTGNAITTEGPVVRLNPKAALSFALAIHELGTNASKYGALATPAGKVKVSWSVDQIGKEPRFKLRWKESGGPLVKQPEQRGFGSMLIERSIAYELDGEATVEYRPEGLVCTILAPLRTIRPFVTDRVEAIGKAVS